MMLETTEIETENYDMTTLNPALNRKIEYVEISSLRGNESNLRERSSYDLEEMTKQLIALSSGENDEEKIAQILMPLIVVADSSGLTVIEGNRRLAAITERFEQGLPVNPDVPIIKISKAESGNQELLIQLQIIFGTSNKRLSGYEKAKGLYQLFVLYQGQDNAEILDTNPDMSETGRLRASNSRAKERLSAQSHLDIQVAALGQYIQVFEGSPDWLLEVLAVGGIAMFSCYSLLNEYGDLSSIDESYPLKDFYDQCVEDNNGTPSTASILKTQQSILKKWKDAEQLEQIRIQAPDIAAYIDSGSLANVEIAQQVIKAAEKSGIAPDRIVTQALEAVGSASGTAEDEVVLTSPTDINRAALRLSQKGTDSSAQDGTEEWDDEMFIQQITAYIRSINNLKTGKAFKILGDEVTMESVSSEVRIALYKLLKKTVEGVSKIVENEKKNYAKKGMTIQTETLEDEDETEAA